MTCVDDLKVARRVGTISELNLHQAFMFKSRGTYVPVTTLIGAPIPVWTNKTGGLLGQALLEGGITNLCPTGCRDQDTRRCP